MLKIPNLKVYLRKNTPVHYHYSKNERIGDIVAVADPGYLLFSSNQTKQWFENNKGAHGYNKFVEFLYIILDLVTF